MSLCSELVARAEDDLLLSAAKVSEARTKVLLAEIGIAIFSAHKDIVGQGMFDATAGCPADQDVVLFPTVGTSSLPPVAAIPAVVKISVRSKA